MSEGETDLEVALKIIGEISSDLSGAGFWGADGDESVAERVRSLLRTYAAEHAQAEAFRTALASALEARDSDGDADLITQATSLLGTVRWCRQQESQVRLRSALAFLNSPFSFERLDLDALTPQQNQWRRALLALKDLRTAVDAVNEEFSQTVDSEEFPMVRRACTDITHNMDVLLAVLSSREGREALLSLIPDVANGGELSSAIDEPELDSPDVRLVLWGPWTPLLVEQYVREVQERFRKADRKGDLAGVLNPSR